MLRTIDLWAAKHVFYPPIIALCRLLRRTQYGLARDLMFFAWVIITFDNGQKGTGIIVMTLCFLGTFFAMLIAAFANENRPSTSEGFWRFLWFSLAGLGFYPMIKGHWEPFTEDILFLAAEYARTITKLPPRKKREKKARRRLIAARVRA